MRSGYAVMVGGPEDGRTMYVGACRRPPRRIDCDEEGRVARYVRVTRLQFDPNRAGGPGHVGQTTYRFAGFVEANA